MSVGAKSSTKAASGPRLPARYRVRRHIASGGMASVWCAEDRLLGRAVAVKVLAERFAHDEFAVRRFKREARTAARVSAHPHVVTIFDVGDIEPRAGEVVEGKAPPARAFIVMEYLAGGTVADAIRVGAVRRHEALRWLAEAASALDHAHERGIVHRDIKPANFLLDKGRVLHVADFGIARLQSEDTITSSGELFGTAAYLAPEQALGGEATSASDRYSLAVAAFELLVGERPFTAPNFAAQARQHVEDEPPRASAGEPELPSAVDPVLIRGMAKQPGDRYETAGAFVAALRDALEAPPTAATRPLAAPQYAATGGRRASAWGSRPAPAKGRSAAAAIVPASGSPRRGGRMSALVALVLVAIGVALVGILGQSGPGSSSTADRATAPKATTRAPAHHRSKHKQAAASSTTAAVASSTTTAAASSSSAPSGAAALQSQGHQELVDGSYSNAISTLHQALSSADPSSLTYAYALYDLGRALMLSGDPKDAVPVLEQRLKIPDQTPVVQQTLDQAKRAAGIAPAPAAPTTSTSPPAGAAPKTGGKPASPPGHGPGHGRGHEKHGDAGNSGGAGVPLGGG
ncbi:MAG TPA: protein kinase [Solirubrobacteraceae bacterium]|jgi:serine/threonine-protein kinase